MSLEQKINNQIKAAMKAKDQVSLRGLRAIKAALLLAKTQEGAGDAVSEKEEIAILSKMAKQRRDSISIYEKQNRADLAEKEKEELQTIESFLPKQLTDDELKSELGKIISNIGASSMADMGKVMGAATQALSGKADGKKMSQIVRELLS